MRNWVIPPSMLDSDEALEWLRWVDRIQKSVCARYIGEPVVAFEHDRGPAPSVEDEGIVRAQYGPVAIIASLGPEERREGKNVLAPYGFAAAAPGMMAGHIMQTAGDKKTESVSYAIEKNKAWR